MSRLWDEVYNMEGRALASWLTYWQVGREEIGSTLYGEKVYLFCSSRDIKVFDQWSRWREAVMIYYDGFLEATEGLNLHYDELVEVLVWKLCVVLGIVRKLEKSSVEFDAPDAASLVLFL